MKATEDQDQDPQTDHLEKPLEIADYVFCPQKK